MVEPDSIESETPKEYNAFEIRRVRMKRVRMSALITLCLIAAILIATGRVRADETEEAYALNQDAMTDMSMAQFKSAAEKFIEAARLVPDYGIKDRPLRYTPTFLAAWAYEKLRNVSEACRYFKKFLEIASQLDREPSKVQHAESYIKLHCGTHPPDHDNRF
jgi:tetratricopeptide (TPR) repeat protein